MFITNVYYFWVRNRSTIPTKSVVNRKNSSAFVSNLIDAPERFSYKYYSITDTNKFIINKIGSLNNSDIVLNVDIRSNNIDSSRAKVGDIITEVNREPTNDVNSFEELVNKLEKSGRSSLLLKILREDEQLWITIKFFN